MEQNSIDMDAKIQSAKTALETHQASLKNKQYAVSSNDLHLALLLDFFEREAKWNGMEALGVTQVKQKLEKIKENGLKDGFFYLGKLELDAISFFHSSGSGKGYASATNFITMIKPFNEPLKEAKADIDKLNRLETELAAAEEGIDAAPPVDKPAVDEFENETTN
jgi:hypothetical protein